MLRKLEVAQACNGIKDLIGPAGSYNNRRYPGSFKTHARDICASDCPR